MPLLSLHCPLTVSLVLRLASVGLWGGISLAPKRLSKDDFCIVLEVDSLRLITTMGTTGTKFAF